MKRKDDQYLLSELLDGELPQEQADALRRRLAADETLAAEGRRYEALDGVLGEIGREMPEVDWELQRETIRAALVREALLRPLRRAWPGRLIRWTAGVSAAAAALVALALAVQWFMTGPAGPVPEMAVKWLETESGGIPAMAHLIDPSPFTPAAGVVEVAYAEPEEGPGLEDIDTAPSPIRPGTIVVAAGGFSGPGPAQAGFGGFDEL